MGAAVGACWGADGNVAVAWRTGEATLNRRFRRGVGCCVWLVVAWLLGLNRTYVTSGVSHKIDCFQDNT